MAQTILLDPSEIDRPPASPATVELDPSEIDVATSAPVRPGLSKEQAAAEIDRLRNGPSVSSARFPDTQPAPEFGQPARPTQAAADILRSAIAGPNLKQPLPRELQSQEQQNAEAPVFRNPRTGRTTPRGSDFGTGPLGVLDSPVIGAQEIAGGVARMAAPAEALLAETGRGVVAQQTGQVLKPAMTSDLSKQGAEAAHQIIGGAFKTAEPLMVAGGAVAPLKTALALGGTMLSQAAIEAGLEKLGLPKEYAAVAGDLGGLIVGGAAVGKLEEAALKARIRRILQDRLDAQFRARQAAERAAENVARPKIEGPGGPPAPNATPQQPAPGGEPPIVEGEFEDLTPAGGKPSATPQATPTPEAPIAEEVPPAATPQTALEIVPGAKFTVGDRTFTIDRLSKGTVRFTAETPAGATKGSLPVGVFRQMLAKASARPQADQQKPESTPPVVPQETPAKAPPAPAPSPAAEAPTAESVIPDFTNKAGGYKFLSADEDTVRYQFIGKAGAVSTRSMPVAEWNKVARSGRPAAAAEAASPTGSEPSSGAPGDSVPIRHLKLMVAKGQDTFGDQSIIRAVTHDPSVEWRQNSDGSITITGFKSAGQTAESTPPAPAPVAPPVELRPEDVNPAAPAAETPQASPEPLPTPHVQTKVKGGFAHIYTEQTPEGWKANVYAEVSGLYGGDLGFTPQPKPTREEAIAEAASKAASRLDRDVVSAKDSVTTDKHRAAARKLQDWLRQQVPAEPPTPAAPTPGESGKEGVQQPSAASSSPQAPEAAAAPTEADAHRLGLRRDAIVSDAEVAHVRQMIDEDGEEWPEYLRGRLESMVEGDDHLRQALEARMGATGEWTPEDVLQSLIERRDATYRNLAEVDPGLFAEQPTKETNAPTQRTEPTPPGGPAAAGAVESGEPAAPVAEPVPGGQPPVDAGVGARPAEGTIEPTPEIEANAPEQYEVSGDTYRYKQRLKALGGKWDAQKKVWLIPADKADAARKISSKLTVTPVQKGGTPQVQAPEPKPTIVKATSKSERDFPVTAKIQGDTITVTTKRTGPEDNERAHAFDHLGTVSTITIKRSEWPTAENPGKHFGNPAYDQHQLVRRLLGVDKVEDPQASEQLERIADAHVSAINEALKKESQAATTPVEKPTSQVEAPAGTPASTLPAPVELDPAEIEAAEPGSPAPAPEASTVEGEEAENGTSRTGLPSGGESSTSGAEHPEALAGVQADDVPGTRPEEGAVPVSAGGSAADRPDAGGPASGGDGLQPGKGDRVPGVVPTSGREGSAQPNVQSVEPRTLAGDFRLTPEEAAEIENSGAKTKARNNVEAIRTIKQILAENRAPTAEEQLKIARYVGWGQSELAQGVFKGKPEWAGIRENLKDMLTPEEWDALADSTLNAHYTRRDIATAMWDTARRFGFRAGGSVLEPGMGIGNFFMMMPEDLLPGTSRTGVEMDLLTGAMANALFPGSQIIVKPFQKTELPDGFFDFAIGNVPFAQHGVVDPAFKKQPFLTKSLHNYFFAKSIEKLRPGGVMLAITSRYTLDSIDAPAKAFRAWMDKRVDFLGAIRLPRDTFQANAGTAVTVDIIALQKRADPDKPSAYAQSWGESKEILTEDGYRVDINEFYHANPEMMMGEMRGGTQYFRGYPELFGEFSIDKLNDLLRKLPDGIISSWAAEVTGARDNLVENYPEAAHIKDGQMAYVNGALVKKEGAYFRPVPLVKKKLARAKGLIELRGAAREVIRTQYLDLSDEEIAAARAELNRVYDAFVEEHGAVNTLGNIMVFADDPDWPLLTALEDWDKDAKIAKKRPIFTERTIQKPKRIEKVDTAAEALAVSLNDTGRIDWDRMQELTGREPSDLQRDLAGKIFRNPVSKQWETADEYLSGNVRKKLRDAQFASEQDPSMAVNVEALKGVLPVNLKPGEIRAPLGATWIPEEDYEQFAEEVLRVERNPADKLVRYVPQTGSFAVRESWTFTDNGVANKTEFGNAYYNGMELFQMALNGNSPVARDHYEDENGNDRSIKNPDATIELVEKQNSLRDRFSEWLWSDPERAARLAERYNEERNNLRLREHDGSHLTFPGLNKSWLRNGDAAPHQKNAVWRTITSGNTLYAHVVGAGKTLEAVMSAMELRRLGLAKKPMVTVPNHLVGQWKDDWLKAYPGAQILVPTKKDFEKKNRQKLMSRIATGNYDGVIVGHQSFGLLPVKDETFKSFMENELKDIEDAIATAAEGKNKNDQYNDPTIKQLVRRRKQLQVKLEKRLKRDEKDTGLTFEELGVDWLFVDEADLYKNLGYTTMMDRIAGLPNSDANRSTDMLLKTKFISDFHGGDRGVVFMTGTPVSNSIAEVWTMMRYLIPRYLEREGMDQFDSWAKTFGRTRTQTEVAPEGGRFIQRTRFSRFQNAPELMNMFRLTADIKTAKQLNLPTPAVYSGTYVDVVSPASEDLKQYVQQIGERADAVRAGSVDPDEDNMLKISSDGRKASLDMRLVDPLAKEDSNSKANKAVANILGINKEFERFNATQLVFLDLSTPKSEKVTKKKADESQIANTDEQEAESVYGEKEAEEEETETADEAKERFTVYNEIRSKLIAGGMKPAQVAFIHDAKTDAQKIDLFRRMNAGQVRVLLGSTEKMGAGMNVQARLLALHHLDAPWRPRDMGQRDGRIIRQGNLLWEEHQIPVRLYRYMTEGSFDAFMWETLASKAAPIEQLMDGDPNIRDVEELSPVVLSFEQAKALSSGNPLIREKILVDQDLHKLDVMRASWMTEQANVNQQLGVIPSQINAEKASIAKYEKDIETRNSHPMLVVGGTEYADKDIRSKGAEALVAKLKSLGTIEDAQDIGATYRGFALEASPRTDSLSARVKNAGKENAKVYAQEEVEPKKFMYYEVKNPPRSWLYNVQRDSLGLTPVDKATAEKLHEVWGKTKKDSGLDDGTIRFYVMPGLRLKAASGNYAVSVNYESPAGTIQSADWQVKDFDRVAQGGRDSLRRLEKQKIELESKKGRPFQYEEKYRELQRKQAELAQKLGEDESDRQALAAADEDEKTGAMGDKKTPLGELLKEPNAPLRAKWFMSRRYFSVNPATDATFAAKGHVVTKHLVVREIRSPRRGGDSTWQVDHLASGLPVSGRFYNESHAIAFARQAEASLDLSAPRVTDELQEKLGRLEESFERPEGNPDEALKRVKEQLLAESASPDTPAKQPSSAEGPISAYTPGNGKLKVPTTTYGHGWMHGTADGKPVHSDGSAVFVGEAPGKKATGAMPDTYGRFLTIPESAQPASPDGYSKEIKEDKAGNKEEVTSIWFGDQYPIDAKYYDYVLKRFPKAEFFAGPLQHGYAVWAKQDGNPVAVVMTRKADGDTRAKVLAAIGEGQDPRVRQVRESRFRSTVGPHGGMNASSQQNFGETEDFGSKASAARERLKNRWNEFKEAAGDERGSWSEKPSEGKKRFRLTAQDFEDLTTIGVDYLRTVGRNFEAWSKAMLEEFGDMVKPYLLRIYTNARRRTMSDVAPPEPPSGRPANPLEIARQRRAGFPISEAAGPRAVPPKPSARVTPFPSPAETPAPAAAPAKPKVVRMPGRPFGSEKGSAPMLTDLAGAIAGRFGSEGPKANYSGLGALQTKFVRNLSQLERANPAAWKSAVRAAASKSQASTILRAAVPAITKALEESEYSWPELRLALIESRLRGLRDRWANLADQSSSLNDVDLEKAFDEYFFGLLGAIEGKAGFPQDLAQTAAAMITSGERRISAVPPGGEPANSSVTRKQVEGYYSDLREFLEQTFRQASQSVQTVMEPEWFDAVTGDSDVRNALSVYKRLVERAMAENHALNEGIFSDALGPLDTYYPLIPVDRQQIAGPGRRLPYHKPRNIANHFATGLSEGYDPSMEGLRDRLAGAIRANDKAALLRTLEDEGLLVQAGAADQPFVHDDQEYEAERVEISPAKTIIKDGKVVHIPARMGMMPRWLAHELKPILERRPFNTRTVIDKILNSANWFSLAGPADLVFHTRNLFGTLVSNTPYLEKSLSGKAQSLPVIKTFAAIVRVANMDPSTTEAAADLIEMAKLGLVPDRYASETWSRRAADDLGATLKRASFGPLLFGPKGIDIRTRLLMYRLAKSINPAATPRELYGFVNQLGNYVPALQSEIERSLKSSGVAPFFTAGSTMIKNGINAWTGRGPMPKSGRGLRLWQMLTGGAIGTLAAWVVTYRALTGKWPWEDKRAKLLQIPVGGGNGYVDKYRHSKIGEKLWGPGSEVGYINFGFFSPLVQRGSRALGISGAFETKQLGGNAGQMIEAAQRDAMNSFLHPAAGPVPRALFVGVTGKELYVTSLRDRQGNVEPQFYPGINPRTKPGLPALGARAAAAARELNAFYGSSMDAIGQATGFLGPDKGEKGSKWLRMVLDMTMPGLFANASNPYKRAAALRRQRAGTK